MMRDYKAEYARYHSRPEQIANRSSRNKARRKMVAAGKAKVGDGKDVDHRDGDPRNNARSNLSILGRRANRSKK
jgi:hypothetical protein